MGPEMNLLLLTAASVGFLHTLMGPDHYVPFIAMARAGDWSRLKTAWVTILCGLGHVLGSVVLGLVGIGLGIAITNIEPIESFRGGLAGWALITFGLLYFVWGMRRAFKKHPHKHRHIFGHHTRPGDEHGRSLTPWILFTIFVFGPCEPLIPILMYPAAKSSPLGVALVVAVFGVVTILTMLGVVMLSYAGIRHLSLGKMEKFTHALAGAAIALCGAGIQFMGF